MTDPPAARPALTASAQIRAQQVAALKFCSDDVDIRENNRRVGFTSQSGARLLLVIGGYEGVGNDTVKYIRRLGPTDGPIDGRERSTPPQAADNFTIERTHGNQYHQRYPSHRHPWQRAGK